VKNKEEDIRKLQLKLVAFEEMVEEANTDLQKTRKMSKKSKQYSDNIDKASEKIATGLSRKKEITADIKKAQKELEILKQSQTITL
jgi:hypothetical protein